MKAKNISIGLTVVYSMITIGFLSLNCFFANDKQLNPNNETPRKLNPAVIASESVIAPNSNSSLD
ncbi:hypothetical protein [Urechidicola croceus]|uniref:Uncharacterized protein n=1 Tax=Urechidicola croceus TaxID=1850246 RepID=A0A1D8P578_9FLAO|nr:hypothetical protein [Urechidicola croceus]AOW19724.1 hypothetical protein LPB138_03080 [Urechidicola croceus]